MGSKDRQRDVQQNTEQMSRVTIAGSTWTIPGVIHEVLRGSMELTLGEPVHIGTPLKIEMPGVGADVKVTHCHPDGANRFRVGVLTLDVRSSEASQHPAQNLMAFYALGRGLIPAEKFQVLAHLRTCSACRHAVDAMESVLVPSTTSIGLRPFLLPPLH